MSDQDTAEQVADLHRLFEEADAKGRRLRRVQVVLTVTLVGVVVAALGAIYLKAASMYTKENFQAQLEPQFEELRPHLESTVRGVVEAAAPHYSELGRQRLERVLPQVRDALEAELVGLSDTLARRSEERISTAFQAVQAKQVGKLRTRFPEVDDAEFARLRRQWAYDIQRDTTEALGDFRERVLVDLGNLNNTIESFGPNKYDDFERDQLVRYYAHLWLTLLDEEVLGSEHEGGRDG